MLCIGHRDLAFCSSRKVPVPGILDLNCHFAARLVKNKRPIVTQGPCSIPCPQAKAAGRHPDSQTDRRHLGHDTHCVMIHISEPRYFSAGEAHVLTIICVFVFRQHSCGSNNSIVS